MRTRSLCRASTRTRKTENSQWLRLLSTSSFAVADLSVLLQYRVSP